MKPYELVSRTIRGEKPDRTPVYGWIAWNLDWQASPYKSFTAFEDKYEFDLAHLFGGPKCYDMNAIESLKTSGVEITPEILLDIPLNPVDRMADYQKIIEQLNFYRKDRERFCYVQSNGIFEALNEPLGIENHMIAMALSPDEMTELYRRQTAWNIQFNENMIELGVDMIHVSDDWGSQNSLLFSKPMLQDLIVPYHMQMAERVKKAGKFLSLHCDGNINEAVDQIIKIGYDVVHPWQESAGMSYSTYLNQYADKFTILGGLCVQTTLGFNDLASLKENIERVFALLKGQRWIFCTSHFAQNSCSIEELEFAYDLAIQLARA